MLEKVVHRGLHAKGKFRSGNTCMAKNHLLADVGSDMIDATIPVTTGSPSGLRICYDSQTGNTDALAAQHNVRAGSYREKRLLPSKLRIVWRTTWTVTKASSQSGYPDAPNMVFSGTAGGSPGPLRPPLTAPETCTESRT
jgi:hypothetical protein